MGISPIPPHVRMFGDLVYSGTHNRWVPGILDASPLVCAFCVNSPIDGLIEHPMNYAHGSQFAVLHCGWVYNEWGLPIPPKITSLAPGQWSDCSTASKLIWKDMGKVNMSSVITDNTTGQNTTIPCPFIGQYCMLACLPQHVWLACKSTSLHMTDQHMEAKTNGRHFPDDIFKCIFLNENVLISIKISLKFVPRVKLTISQHWFR